VDRGVIPNRHSLLQIYPKHIILRRLYTFSLREKAGWEGIT